MSHRTVITGGLLVTESDALTGDLVIDDDQIVAILIDAAGVDADEHIDASNLLVLPGAIDAHTAAAWVHEGAPDAALAAQRAAAAGGATTLVADAGRPIAADVAKSRLGADIGRWHPLTGGTRLSADQLSQAVRSGVAGFSASIGAGEGALTEGELLAAMRAIAPLPVPLALTALHPGLDAAEPLAEVAGVMLGLLFAEQTGAWVHLRNLSTAASMQQVTEARARHVRVTASVSALHLTMSGEDGRGLDAVPPVRSREEIEQLWSYVLDESVDCITSGVVERNGQPLSDAQTAFSLFWDEAVTKRGMSRSQAVRQLATNPAQMLGLAPRKGSIRVGGDADLVVFDPEGAWTVRNGDMLHEPRWSPFDGREITGFVVRTLRRGQTIYDAERHDDASTLTPGSGVVLSRTGA